MPHFYYNALDAHGQAVSGNLTVGTRSAVLDHIQGKGLRPVSIKEVRDDALKTAQPPIFRTERISQGSVEIFTRQLANLLTAGVALNRALDIVTRETSKTTVKKQWIAIRNDVLGGASFTAALAKWPQSFSPVYVAMVRAGETGGFLNLVLEQIADFRARENDLKGRVKAALIYPFLLAVLASTVLVFLMIYFIPRFSAIFAEFGGSLPWLTRLIMSISGWMVR